MHRLTLPAVVMSWGLILDVMHKEYVGLKNSQMPVMETLARHRSAVQVLANALNMHLQLIDEIIKDKKEGFQFRLKKEN